MRIVTATRLHLGQSSTEPPTDLADKIANFTKFSRDSCQAVGALIAVDTAEKISGYDLVKEVEKLCSPFVQVVPVTPWGKFVPALNALVSRAAKEDCDWICFVSAETFASQQAMDVLKAHLTMDDDTLVAGARLAGHQYQKDTIQDLNGVTCPWNTLAIWNRRKLSLTGFQLVSEGLLTSEHDEEPSYAGIEEVVAAALLQKILGADNAKVKLVDLPNVDWNVHNFDDPERQKWQEQKMKSKQIRAQRQLDLIKLEGKVYHI